MLIKGTSLCWASFVDCQQDSTHICCWAPAPAARRPQLSIDTSCPQGAQQQTRWSPLLRSIDGTERRKDGRPIPLHVKRPCPAFDFANFWGGGRACDGRMIASTKTKTFIKSSRKIPNESKQHSLSSHGVITSKLMYSEIVPRWLVPVFFRCPQSSLQ